MPVGAGAGFEYAGSDPTETGKHVEPHGLSEKCADATQAESRMTSYDTLTGLRIARDTQRDSVSMKTISWLTMVFLPATFVATFFGMGFFQFHKDSENHSHISVAPEWWLYLAVTLPLTAVVLGAWNGWLWWKERSVDEDI
jgi:hypothetical protein